MTPLTDFVVAVSAAVVAGAMASIARTVKREGYRIAAEFRAMRYRSRVSWQSLVRRNRITDADRASAGDPPDQVETHGGES